MGALVDPVHDHEGRGRNTLPALYVFVADDVGAVETLPIALGGLLPRPPASMDGVNGIVIADMDAGAQISETRPVYNATRLTKTSVKLGLFHAKKREGRIQSRRFVWEMLHANSLKDALTLPACMVGTNFVEKAAPVARENHTPRSEHQWRHVKNFRHHCLPISLVTQSSRALSSINPDRERVECP